MMDSLRPGVAPPGVKGQSVLLALVLEVLALETLVEHGSLKQSSD